jgi:hypothetical protein
LKFCQYGNRVIKPLQISLRIHRLNLINLYTNSILCYQMINTNSTYVDYLNTNLAKKVHYIYNNKHPNSQPSTPHLRASVNVWWSPRKNETHTWWTFLTHQMRIPWFPSLTQKRKNRLNICNLAIIKLS